MGKDFFLIKGGIIVNIALIESLELALKLFPDFTIVERTEDNKHLNPGDAAP
jgi:hypothetical protein